MGKFGFVKLKEDALAFVILLILPLLYLKGAIFFSDNILGSPFTDIKGEASAKLFAYKEVLNFSAPLWSPYTFGGMPFAAAPGAAIFYPFHLICAFLPIHYAINWNIALHLFLSELFTYYFLRHYGVNRFGSMTAGIIYAFSAPQIMHIYAGHLIAITSMPWTPLMLLSLDKLIHDGRLRNGMVLSIAIALQLMAGYTQYLFYSLIAISFYLLFTIINLYLIGRGLAEICKKGFLFAVFVSFGLILSAVQILPTLEMIQHSTRHNLSYQWVSIFSFPPENLITIILPDFFGDMINTPYWGKNYLWEMTAYVGILPLLLVFISLFYSKKKEVLFFAGLTILSIILAFGKHTPLLKLLYSYVPGFNLFRGNSKFIFLTSLSLAVLSGFGLDAFMKGVDNKNKTGLSVLGIGLFILTGLFVAYFTLDGIWFRQAINRVIYSQDIFNDPRPFMQNGFEHLAMISFRNSIVWASALLISGMTLLLLYSYGKIKEQVVAYAIIGLVVFDLFLFGMRYMKTFDLRETYLDRGPLSFLKRDKEPFRVIAPQLDPNIGISSEIETLGGYGNMEIKRYSEFINLSQGDPIDVPNLALEIKNVNKLTNLLNAKYVVLPSISKPVNPALRKVFDNGRISIYHNIDAAPRAFIVHETKVIKERNGIFRELISPGFNPITSAITEEELDRVLSSPSAKSPVPRFILYSPNRIAIDADLAAPGLLVLGDIWYPGWKAFVDGKDAKIYKTNYVMRGVAMPEGRHRVEFLYDPLSFKIGASISLMSLICAAGFLYWDRRRNEDH